MLYGTCFPNKRDFFFAQYSSDDVSLRTLIRSRPSPAMSMIRPRPTRHTVLFLIIVVIGGSFFSTSSGLRLLKIYFLFKYSINEILSYTKPNNIYNTKLKLIDSNIEQKDINKYFLSVLIFIISLFIITSLLSIFNISFENSFKLGILTLMNTVNSSMYELNNFDFFELNSYSKLIMIVFMIIGRVELLTILIIVKKFLFKT